MKKKDRLKWAQFRFEVIAPLVQRSLSKTQRLVLMREISSRSHLNPDGVERRVAERTLRTWLSKYQLHGFAGLENQARSDIGRSYAIDKVILDAAEKLRRELPERSIHEIMCQLAEKGLLTESISPSTLNYHLNLRGAKREYLKPDLGSFQRFEKEFINQLWQADTSGGLWVPDPQFPGRYKEIRLISFIDDASRVCTHAEFYFDEKLPSLIDCFRKALIVRACPEEIYTDNARIFHSQAFKLMCAQLGIKLSHSEDRKPEGRGKIERHIGTIKHAFYKEAKHAALKDLEEANKFFFAWLAERYHNTEHKGLKQTPLERWAKDESKNLLRFVLPEQIRKAMLIRVERKVNSRTACISLNNRTYQAGADLAGKTVEVRWDTGSNAKALEVWKDGRLCEVAQEIVIPSDIDYSRRPARESENRHRYFASSREYLSNLASRYAHEKPLLSGIYLSQNEFTDLVSSVLTRSLEEEDRLLLSAEFARLHPLQADETKTILEQAANVKGKDRHLGTYCQWLYEKIKLNRS